MERFYPYRFPTLGAPMTFQAFVSLALANAGSYSKLAEQTGFSTKQLFNFSGGGPPSVGTDETTPATDARYRKLGRLCISEDQDPDVIAQAFVDVAEQAYQERLRRTESTRPFHNEIAALQALGLPSGVEQQTQELLLLILEAGRQMPDRELEAIRKHIENARP